MNRHRVLVSLLACLALGACASEDAVRPQGAAASGVGNGSAGPGQVGRQLLPAADNGLELRRLRITDMLAEDEAGRPVTVDRRPEIAAALMKYADGEILDEGDTLRLQRNGFRFVRVNAGQIDALLGELGGVTVDVKGWHGQACDWREVAAFPVGSSGRAVAVDGRVRRFSGGRLRLMMRGWTMQMEDGPCLHLEVMPDYNLSRPSRLEQALGRKMFQGERFPSMALDVLAEAGYAYVLACESPGVEWMPADEGDEGAAGTAGADDQLAADDGSTRRPVYGPQGVGPGAVMPVTVGELLLKEESIPAVRDLLLFVPRIPDAMFPGGAPSAVGVKEGEA